MTAQVKAFAIGRHAANSIQHTLRCKKSTYFLQKAVASILPGTLAWYATWMCGSSLKSCCWICGVMDSVTCKGEVCAKQLRWGWSRWVADAQHCNMINAVTLCRPKIRLSRLMNQWETCTLRYLLRLAISAGLDVVHQTGDEALLLWFGSLRPSQQQLPTCPELFV